MSPRHLVPDPGTTPHVSTPDTTTGAAPTGSVPTGAVPSPDSPAAATDRDAWLKLSAALSEHAPVIAERDDITVTVAPGAGHGAPGCFIPSLATIELDGATFTDTGLDPRTFQPARPSDRERYPAAWGVFTHECAHARHSHWDLTPSGTGTGTGAEGEVDGAAPGGRGTAVAPSSAAVSAATLLEESRIEAAHLSRRPGDRHWLRAAATALILPEFPTSPPSPDRASPASDGPATSVSVPTDQPATEATSPPAAATSAGLVSGPIAHPAAAGQWDAASAAGLVLARVDAGVLDEEETRELAALITTVLGEARLTTLRGLWQKAHTVADDDATTMIELGRDWCRCLGIDPDAPEPARTGTHPGITSPLAGAVATTLAGVVATERPAATTPPPDPTRTAERAAQLSAERATHAVFATDPTARGGPAHPTRTRAATPAEQAAARRLARALKQAATRDRVATVTTSSTPPGRLQMRDVLASDAQRAAGAVPTAEPFTRTTRRHVPTPPLRVGIACDVSGSMNAVTKAIASAAWIVGRAVGYVPDAKAATVLYGETVTPITRPGQHLTDVTLFDANDCTEKFTRALDALDGALDLSRPGAARLLVIVSDGVYTATERQTGQQRITRLRASGCGVLWIALHHGDEPMTGATPLILNKPAAAPEAIARAVTDTLRTT